jgi:transcriptional regulator with XRE-family HTH domain
MKQPTTKQEKEIDDLLQVIKQKTGLTQEEIAKRIGYNRSYISQAKKTDSEKLYMALKKEFMLENEHPAPAPARDESLNELIQANRILAESNKVLADAHFIISKSNEDLIQITKAAFNLLPSRTNHLQPADPGTNVGGQGFAPVRGTSHSKKKS